MYTNNIEMMMDFMSLSFSIDRPTVSRQDKQLAVKLQKDLLELVTPDTPNQKNAYKLMKNVYDINYRKYK